MWSICRINLPIFTAITDPQDGHLEAIFGTGQAGDGWRVVVICIVADTQFMALLTIEGF